MSHTIDYVSDDAWPAVVETMDAEAVIVVRMMEDQGDGMTRAVCTVLTRMPHKQAAMVLLNMAEELRKQAIADGDW